MKRSSTMMRAIGWGTLLVLPLGFVVHPAGLLLGTHAASPHGPPLSPYLFMRIAIYAAWGILMVRGARDPLAHRDIADYGILANALHGLVMLVQSFLLPHEIQHPWADVPLLFLLCAALWLWHPARTVERSPV